MRLDEVSFEMRLETRRITRDSSVYMHNTSFDRRYKTRRATNICPSSSRPIMRLYYKKDQCMPEYVSVKIGIQSYSNCMINNNVHRPHVYIPYDRPLWQSYRSSENQKPRIVAKVRWERVSLNGLHFEIWTIFGFSENFPRKFSSVPFVSVSIVATTQNIKPR